MADTRNKELSRESRAMLEEIRKAENQVAESLKAIRERLSSEHLKDRALHKVIRAALAKLERSGCFVRRHPVPALLGGALLGWLALRRRQRRIQTLRQS